MFSFHLKRRRVFTWLLVLMTLGAGVLMAAQLAVCVREVISWKSDPDNALLEKKCGRCHEAARAHNYAKSPAEWRATVKRMLREPLPNRLTTDQERTRIGDELIRRRSADGQTLFRIRCARCHARSAIEPYRRLDPQTLALVVRQHARQKNFAIRVWEGEEVAQYVSEKLSQWSRSSSRFTPREHYLYQEVCGTCHTPRFIRRAMCREMPNGPEWNEVLARMLGKAPQLVEENQMPILASYAESICRTRNPVP